ncbi:MAG: DUF362 domain-containing protein [Anaerolineales bacterium]
MRKHRKKPPMDRRQFLQFLGTGGLAVLAGCRPKETEDRMSSDPSTPSTTKQPATSTTIASPTRTLRPQTPTTKPRATVALGFAGAYEDDVIHSQIRRMLHQLDGAEELLSPGARVGLKPNLTGGPWWDTPERPPATEMFATHPAVVGALARWAKDMGAGKIYVMDGIADEAAWDSWGYSEMAKPYGATLVNLCRAAPYSDFARFPVGDKGRVYHQFYLNGLLQEVDVFISIAKLKVHSVMGVTLALKNLIGLTPIDSYKKNAEDTARTSLHGNDGAYDTRLPQVIVELNLARPVDLAVIDGVLTCEGGAGPWDAGMSQVRPGILAAGLDPVAVDAVGSALMGFNPRAESQSDPFRYTDNYLSLALVAGLGTNRLEEIAVTGGTLEDMQYPFRLPWV